MLNHNYVTVTTKELGERLKIQPQSVSHYERHGVNKNPNLRLKDSEIYLRWLKDQGYHPFRDSV